MSSRKCVDALKILEKKKEKRVTVMVALFCGQSGYLIEGHARVAFFARFGHGRDHLRIV
jgi:hypothetical protein